MLVRTVGRREEGPKHASGLTGKPHGHVRTRFVSDSVRREHAGAVRAGFGGRADKELGWPRPPLLTHLRHGRLKTFAAQKHCSSRFAKRDIVVLSIGSV